MKDNKEKAEARKIRDEYTGKKTNNIEKLRKLDAKVKRPAIIFGLVFGFISALILGTGMCLIMTEMGAIFDITSIVPGIIIGAVGLLMAIINYPIYRSILKSRREKYADQVIRLSDRILGFFGCI